MKSLSLSKLTKKAEHLQRDIIFLEQGKVCEVPGCRESAYCLDHVFSRQNRELFFDRANLVRICRGHHRSKTRGWHGVLLKVYDYIRDRNGIKKFNQMWNIDKNRVPWDGWNRNYINSKIQEFKKNTVGAYRRRYGQCRSGIDTID